jgi:REP element-mobilizing transposase RayT
MSQYCFISGVRLADIGEKSTELARPFHSQKSNNAPPIKKVPAGFSLPTTEASHPNSNFELRACFHNICPTLGAVIAQIAGMARTTEIVSTELPYHVSARCRNKDYFPIPIEEVWKIMEDYLFFISNAYSIEILSFVLMTNHFHMLVKTPKGNLSEAMNYFMGQTSRCINEKAGVINQLYGRRYHRSIIDSNHYLMHVYKYVYRNPVEAGLSARAEDYPLSTLYLKMGKGKLNFPVLADTILFESPNFSLRWLNQAVDIGNKQIIKKALKKEKFELPKKIREIRKKPNLATELY